MPVLVIGRTQSILNLRYRHIRVSLLRDPQGGPHRIVINFKFEYTKGLLSAKDEEKRMVRPTLVPLLVSSILSPLADW